MTNSWKRMIRSAGAAGISPQEFWKLPVRDWFALCSPPENTQTLTGADLKRLIAMYPDTKPASAQNDHSSGVELSSASG